MEDFNEISTQERDLGYASKSPSHEPSHIGPPHARPPPLNVIIAIFHSLEAEDTPSHDNAHLVRVQLELTFSRLLFHTESLSNFQDCDRYLFLVIDPSSRAELFLSTTF